MTTTTKILPGGGVGVSLSDPAQLIAAVPPLLGFRPADSIVLLGLGGPGGSRVGPVVRGGLPTAEHENEAVQTLLPLLLDHHVGTVVIVLIGRNPAHPPPSSGPPHRQLVDRLREALAGVGWQVPYPLWAQEIRKGARWAAYDDGQCGVLPDDTSTVTATAFTAAGQVTFGSREELARLLVPDDAPALARRAKLLTAATDVLSSFTDDELLVREGFEVVRVALNRMRRRELSFSDNQVVGLALALSQTPIRDTCLALPLVEHTCLDAERLWLELVRRTPAPERAEPAALLCYSAYQRGEGALAGLAVDNAREANPGHTLAALLSTCLSRGVHPDRIRGLGKTDHLDALWVPAP
ncbi:DUF4192 domain-containing protein [Amycolatopsis sp. GM8]|uniref:DUF4192 domain-containing protein n=1 Tax=Amycolatopsis sp. GM8 TaxID=2896530 RepID=UPI001F2F4AD7|nr:DUF4192 domain-containing protein [Amycolatopsis sp. GM8]